MSGVWKRWIAKNLDRLRIRSRKYERSIHIAGKQCDVGRQRTCLEERNPICTLESYHRRPNEGAKCAGSLGDKREGQTLAWWPPCSAPSRWFLGRRRPR